MQWHYILLDSGFEVTVYNRTKEKTDTGTKEKGAKVATSPKEIAENSECGYYNS